MKHTNLLLTLLCLFIFSISASAKKEISHEERRVFINTYYQYAIEEMRRTQIPASITMAQFILESDWGRGELFVNANAGFGIKCKKEWRGETYYYKDDDLNARKELIESCFRAYPSIKKSFTDHSDFLKNRHYYKPLFKLSSKDYKSWAYGLKECNYATDEDYAKKLIDLIEEYGLFQYDYVAEVLPEVNSTPTTPVRDYGEYNYPHLFAAQETSIAKEYSAPATTESTSIYRPQLNTTSRPIASTDVVNNVVQVSSPVVRKRYQTAPIRRTAYTVKQSYRKPASSF